MTERFPSLVVFINEERQDALLSDSAPHNARAASSWQNGYCMVRGDVERSYRTSQVNDSAL